MSAIRNSVNASIIRKGFSMIKRAVSGLAAQEHSNLSCSMILVIVASDGLAGTLLMCNSLFSSNTSDESMIAHLANSASEQLGQGFCSI